MKHPFNQQACLERLKNEYDKYGKLIVAFDFDNTIYTKKTAMRQNMAVRVPD